MIHMYIQMMKAGMLGRKSNKGFFLYEKGKKDKKINPEAVKIMEKHVTNRQEIKKEDIQNRLIGRFINEAAFCLQDGVIDSPVAGDIGAVFGIGFPPFLGGPFRFLDHVGVAKYCDMLQGEEKKD